MGKPSTPMLDKENSVSIVSEEIRDFSEWLQYEKSVVFATYDKRQDDCRTCGHTEIHSRNKDNDLQCTVADGCNCIFPDFGNPHKLIPIFQTLTQLLAEYFNIDLTQIEYERRKLLEWITQPQ